MHSMLYLHFDQIHISDSNFVSPILPYTPRGDLEDRATARVVTLTIKSAKYGDLPRFGCLVNRANTQTESVNTRGRATQGIRSAIRYASNKRNTISNTICPQQRLHQMVLVMGMVMDDITAATFAVDDTTANANEPYSHERQHKRNNRITGTGRRFGKGKRCQRICAIYREEQQLQPQLTTSLGFFTNLIIILLKR
jgi:hypothetical protein